MSPSQSTPPPPSGNGLKYGIVGALLLAAAVLVILLMTCEEEGPVVEATPDAGHIERSTSLAQPTIEIPEPEPDASNVDAGGPNKIVKTVYVRDRWDCAGTIAAASARSTIGANQRQVRNCYERRLKHDHTLAGTINLRVRVGSDGSVSGVQVGGSMRDPEVFSCVRNLASTWRFAAPTGGSCAVIQAPFRFTPRE